MIDSRKTWSSHDLHSRVENGEITPAHARQSCINGATAAANGPYRRRWIEHVLFRLAFERSMLGNVPRYDGELTPVILQAFAREHGAESPKCTVTEPGRLQLESPVPLPAHIGSGPRLELSEDDWRDLMQDSGYAVPEKKPRRVSAKVDAAPLLNPTREQAERLQTIWNLRMQLACRSNKYVSAKAAEVYETTQAVYSAKSKGDYVRFRTIEITADGRQVRIVWRNRERVRSGEPVARIRTSTIGAQQYKPDAVVFISDKPGKPLPIDLDNIEAELRAALASDVEPTTA